MGLLQVASESETRADLAGDPVDILLLDHIEVNFRVVVKLEKLSVALDLLKH